MKKELITTPSGKTITLIISAEGYCHCPVCGELAKNKGWRPYDELGHPSYDICSCGFEFGFDDAGEPPYHGSWENYREKWLNSDVGVYSRKNMSRAEKLIQLKNIQVEET